MSRIRDTLLIGLALILVAASAQAAEFPGRVVGVTDGDTLKVLHDGRAEVVCLHGIDAPEQGHPFGQRAKQAAAHLAMGHVVTVAHFGHRDHVDRFIVISPIGDHDRSGATLGAGG